MPDKPKLYPLLAATLLGLVFLLTVYRAMTQSISHDEALIHMWLFPSLLSNLKDSNVANVNVHFLYVFLARLCTWVFGLSDFAMRIPSLVGTALYLASIFFVCLYLFGRSLLFLLLLALLSLNPFLMDFMAIARGYILALGFTFFALYQLLRYTAAFPAGAQSEWRRVIYATLALALSVSINLSLFNINLALTLFTLLMLLGLALLDRDYAKIRPVVATGALFLIPWATTLLMIALAPYRKLMVIEKWKGNGFSDFVDTSVSLVNPSLYHHPLALLGRLTLPYQNLVELAGTLLVPLAIFALGAWGFVLALRWIRAGRTSLIDPRERAAFFIMGPLLASIFIYKVNHKFLHTFYPTDRTGLFFIPFFTLACGCLAGKLLERSRGRLGRLVQGLVHGVALILVLLYAVQLNTSHYALWRFNAGAKGIVQLLEQEHRKNPGKPLRVCVDWILAPTYLFYKDSCRMDWIKQMDAFWGYNGKMNFDAYIFLDPSLVKELDLKVIHQDEISGEYLALPAGAPSSGKDRRPLRAVCAVLDHLYPPVRAKKNF